MQPKNVYFKRSLEYADPPASHFHGTDQLVSNAPAAIEEVK